jgi:hypothetical protein
MQPNGCLMKIGTRPAACQCSTRSADGIGLQPGGTSPDAPFELGLTFVLDGIGPGSLDAGARGTPFNVVIAVEGGAN